MKTHRKTGDSGCRAVILKHFCSTASFWKLETFITSLSGNKGHTLCVDICRDGVAEVRRHILLCDLVSYELRYSKRLSLLEQKCICALGVRNIILSRN